MKNYTTRLELHNAWKATRAIVQALSHALEIANRSDCSSRHDDEDQTGNRPHWANSASVYGDIQTALDRIITETFGVTLGELNVNWGASGSFSKDIFEALASALVKPVLVAPPAIVSQTTRIETRKAFNANDPDEQWEVTTITRTNGKTTESAEIVR